MAADSDRSNDNLLGSLLLISLAAMPKDGSAALLNAQAEHTIILQKMNLWQRLFSVKIYAKYGTNVFSLNNFQFWLLN